MSDYTFKNLSPYEFEELSRDLIQKRDNVFIESFTKGRDGGIDFRYALSNDESVIIQCKQYDKYTDLIHKLRTTEINNVKTLNPSRYIIVTSVGLTPKNKDDIFSLFFPFIKSMDDILGRDDINNLLGIYPDIEKSHYKLWFSSIAIFEKLMNRAIYSRSSLTKEQLIKQTSFYVHTESFNNALKILNENRYVILSGIPGIGKTTVANMLSLKCLAEEYEFFEVASNIDEAFTVLDNDNKQIFYYDDFLGSNFLEDGLEKNEDKKLISFIQQIRKSSNKILIMTTREYILSQAEIKYESLHLSDIGIAKCTIDIAQYTKLAKAKILYNHLFFSKVPLPYIDELLKNKQYLNIIKHRNYNPRLIYLMTNNEVGLSVTPDKYYDHFIYNLDNPERIWENAFNEKISNIGRSILFVVGTSVNNILFEDLFLALTNLYNSQGRTLTPYDFKKALRETEDTFLRIIKKGKSERWIEFSNPSIFDYIKEVLKNDTQLLQMLINGACFFNHLLEPYFGDGSDYKGKITLANELLAQIKNKIIYNWDNLKELTIQNHYPTKTKLERLNQLLKLFPLEVNTDFREFFINKVLDVKPSLIYGYDKELVINFYIVIAKFIDLDASFIMTSYFDTIDSVEDLYQFTYLQLVSIDAFENFVNSNHDSIKIKIQETVDKVFEVEYEYDDKTYLEDLTLNIDQIVYSFSSDNNFEFEKLKINEIIEELEYRKNGDIEPDDDDEPWYGGNQDSPLGDDYSIDNMFDSLR